MSLGILNKRNKMKWDNCFDPVGASSFNVVDVDESGDTSDLGTISGYVDGNPVYTKVMKKIVTADDVTNRRAKFKLAEGRNCILLEGSGSVIEENASITKDNHPYFLGHFNTTTVSPSTSTFIHLRQGNVDECRFEWSTSTSHLVEGSIIYLKVSYILLDE